MSTTGSVLSAGSSVSEVRLRPQAAVEVKRLRSLRERLFSQRLELDLELKAVNDLLAVYLAFEPSLGRPEDLRTSGSGRHRNLGARLRAILEDAAGSWLALSELHDSIGSPAPGLEPPTLKDVRNALYHLRKRDSLVESQHADSGLQYRVRVPLRPVS